MLKAGQYKVPFGRQELTSSGNQQFVDRSLVSNRFARGRDIGLQLWGTPHGGKLDWRVGVFNGNGRTVVAQRQRQLPDQRPRDLPAVRRRQVLRGRLRSTDRPLFAIAAQYESNERPVAVAGTTPAHNADREIVGGDVVFKFKGFSLFGELFDSRATTATTASPTSTTSGFDVQAGYFVIPQKFEVAARLAEIDPNSDRDDDEQEERGIAFGYFFNKHAHKLQADYRQIENNATDVTNDEFRLQYQIIF